MASASTFCCAAGPLPGSTHFYIFCLVSFIAYSFKYTGKLNDFDWTIYWGNIAAGVLQPALFLHFVLTFPEKREFVRKHPWLLALVYVPGAILLAAHIVAMRWLQASERLRWNLDRMEMSYGSLFFLAAAIVLWYSYRRASTTILRQQLKWVTRGTILAIVPYTLFYVVPYLMGALPGATHEGFRAVAGPVAADFRLRHLPLPLDGCGSHLQARRGLHAGGGDRGGNVFRAGGGRGRAGPQLAAELAVRWD